MMIYSEVNEEWSILCTKLFLLSSGCFIERIAVLASFVVVVDFRCCGIGE